MEGVEKTSRIKGFYKLSPLERLEAVKKFAQLTDEEASTLMNTGSLPIEDANRMIENVIGVMPIPMGVAVNFLINGRDYLIPMAIEEPSVIAAASNAARMVRDSGGFRTTSTEPIMIGEIQVVGVKDPYGSRFKILSNKSRIIEEANRKDPLLVSIGGGAKDLNVRVLEGQPSMLVVDLYVDCRDAMGANIVNTMAESVAPVIEELTGGDVVLRIVSNLAACRLARAYAKVDKEVLEGEEVVDRIVEAYRFAVKDVYRCATHNKGIMNGVVAVALATGNDTRALEAGAHSYAALGGVYKPLTVWEKDENNNLVGTIEMPMAVGVIGGVTAVHPVAKIALKILGVKNARELGEVMAAVGLAQNLAALRALATEGIQRGHMKLHARNVASMAGAVGEEIDKVALEMVKMGQVRMDVAEKLLLELRARRGTC
ncbi:MAG: hydroxymethylglutaryl-CoA reductase, degradative [Candidatus Bathyarchaeia archaeon]